MNKEKILGALRHILTFGAGYAVSKGKLDAPGAETIIGGLVALVGFIWSWVAPEKKPTDHP